jgi:hypothetical protein
LAVIFVCIGLSFSPDEEPPLYHGDIEAFRLDTGKLCPDIEVVGIFRDVQGGRDPAEERLRAPGKGIEQLVHLLP